MSARAATTSSSAVVHFEAGDYLRMAPVEALGHTQHRREQAAPCAVARAAASRTLVGLLGRAAAVIARDEGHHLDLVGSKPRQIAVLDQVVRVA
jgi:hypothetical protein